MGSTAPPECPRGAALGQAAGWRLVNGRPLRSAPIVRGRTPAGEIDCGRSCRDTRLDTARASQSPLLKKNAVKPLHRTDHADQIAKTAPSEADATVSGNVRLVGLSEQEIAGGERMCRVVVVY